MVSSVLSQPCDKHCIFRGANDLFAWPATEVREITVRPEFVTVPLSDPVLAGLCYVRGEFLPVISLRALLGCNHATPAEERRMLVLKTAIGVWGLLADRVIGLESLQTSLSAAGAQNGWTAATLGWANHRGKVVRVLNPDAFVRFVALTVESVWEKESTCMRQTRVSTASATNGEGGGGETEVRRQFPEASEGSTRQAGPVPCFSSFEPCPGKGLP